MWGREKESMENKKDKYVTHDEYVKDNRHLLLDAEIGNIDWTLILQNLIVVTLFCYGILAIKEKLPMFKTLGVLYNMLMHLWF